MAATNKILNPIRFYNTGTIPDWVNYFPNPNNQNPRIKYIEGQKATSWYKQFMLNKAIIFQFGIVSGTSNDVEVWKYNSSTGAYAYDSTIIGIDITPQSYISETRLMFTYTPTSEGLYYFSMSGQSLKSDPFIVSSISMYNKRLVEITYTNDSNAFGMVFESDYAVKGTFVNVFTPYQYFDGKLISGSGGEKSGFESDSGGFQTTRATIVDKATLYLYNVHKSYDKHLSRLFACNNFTVNGIRYESTDEIESSEIEGTDLIDYTINLREHTITNDY